MIKRFYPTKVSCRKNYYYWGNIWETFDRLKNYNEFLREFELFKKNIDYRTGEEIKKKDYNNLKSKFILYEYRGEDVENDEMLNDVYFDDVLNTIKVYNNKEYVKSDGRITTVGNFNKEIDGVNEKINELKYWNDYVVFEGEKYGIPKVFNNIHRKNDCFGNVERVIDTDRDDIYGCEKCGKDLTMNMIDIYRETYYNDDRYYNIYYNWIIP